MCNGFLGFTDVPALVEVFKPMRYEIKVGPGVRRLGPTLFHDLNVLGRSGRMVSQVVSELVSELVSLVSRSDDDDDDDNDDDDECTRVERHQVTLTDDIMEAAFLLSALYLQMTQKSVTTVFKLGS